MLDSRAKDYTYYHIKTFRISTVWEMGNYTARGTGHVVYVHSFQLRPQKNSIYCALALAVPHYCLLRVVLKKYGLMIQIPHYTMTLWMQHPPRCDNYAC